MTPKKPKLPPTRKRKVRPLITLWRITGDYGEMFSLPVATVSEANQREHWATKQKRKKSQQAIVASCMAALGKGISRKPLRVQLTRLGVRKLDADNLAGSFKHVQDAVAKWLGKDDGKIEWDYQQRTDGSERGVIVTLVYV